MAVTDASGAVIEKHVYWPYGQQLMENTTGVHHLFTGQERDFWTPLYYYHARYYDFMEARFIQPDTIVPDPANPQDLNRYSYVSNNPLKYTDPTGHSYGSTNSSACVVTNFCGGGSGGLLFGLAATSSSGFSFAGTADYSSSGYGLGNAGTPMYLAAGMLPYTGSLTKDWFQGGSSGGLGGGGSVRLGSGGSSGKIGSESGATISTVAKGAAKPGEFSIVDWNGYPAGIPKPQGPFRLVEGAEYDAARKAANQANNQIRQTNNLRGQPVDVHEVQAVKFGGSPTDPSNKVIIDRTLHRQEVTPWWNQLQKDLGGG